MSNPVAQDVVHACVVVADGEKGAETHYLRAGRGAPVLLLAEATAASALIGGLPRNFRSIAPKLPGPVETVAANFNPWIRGFLDALGIPKVSVIVGPCLSAQTLSFALLEPERVDKLVFLVGGCGDAPAPEGEIGVVDRLRTSGQPLLATPLDVTDPQACGRGLAEIAAFLDKQTSDQD